MKRGLWAAAFLGGLALLLLFVFSGEGDIAPGQEGAIASAAGRRPERARLPLDRSVLRAVSRYGKQGPSHAKLDLTVRALRRQGEETLPVEGATILVDDEPVGITDGEGRLVASLAVSDRGEAWHVVWAEEGSERSSPFSFPEGEWPDRELTLLLRSVGRVRGLVLDGEGQPLAAASVVLTPPVAPPQQTGADGRFTFAELPAGGYRLEAWKAGAGAESPVRLVAGGEAQVVLRLSALDSVRGIVVDGQGAAVPDAELELREVAEETLLGNVRVMPVLDRTRSDAEGRFTFPPTFLTRVVIEARKGGGRASSQGFAPYSPLKLTLRRTGVVTGTVRLQDGTPATGARVDGENPSYLGRPDSDWTHAVGPEARYRLAWVPEGTSTLYAAAPGQTTHQTFGGLEVVPGGEVTFDLVLEAKGVSVEGLVRDQDTTLGIPGVALEARPTRQGEYGGEVKIYARSDAEGRFSLAGTDGEYFFVEATHEDYEPLKTLLQPGKMTIDLERGRRLRGQVVDTALAPIAQFELGTGKLIQKTVRDAQGRFDLTVGRGVHLVSFSADGHRSREVETPGSEDLDLGRVVLAPAEPWEVTVVDAEGRAAAGARVFRFDTIRSRAFQEARGGMLDTLTLLAVTDEQGRARVTPSQQSECLAATLPGWGPSLEPPCGRAEEGSREVLLRLAPEAVIVGDTGVPGCRVEVFPEGFVTEADASGRYRIGGLGPGPHGLTFRHGDPGPQMLLELRKVELVVGEVTTLNLEDPERGRVRLTLRADTDEMILLTVKPLTPEGEAAPTPGVDPGGMGMLDGLHGEHTLTFEALKPGPVRITAGTAPDARHLELVVVAGETVEAALDLEHPE